MVSMLVEGTEAEEKVVTVTLVYSLLTSRGKYILGLATGSALASVITAASAVTKNDFVCILSKSTTASSVLVVQGRVC